MMLIGRSLFQGEMEAADYAGPFSGVAGELMVGRRWLHPTGEQGPNYDVCAATLQRGWALRRARQATVLSRMLCWP